MPDTDVREALELLKKAHQLLKDSDIENLKKSSDYLRESIQCLNRNKQETSHGTH